MSTIAYTWLATKPPKPDVYTTRIGACQDSMRACDTREIRE